MIEVKPFNGIRYNLEKVKIDRAVAPPYDVISPEEREELKSYDSNICHVTLPGADYEKAAELFQSWQSQGILIQDENPSFYFYSQEYLDQGVLKKRLGCLGRVRIQETQNSDILPHEYTLSKPLGDRLKLLGTVEANLSPIFGIAEDQDQTFFATMRDYVSQHPPLIDVSIAEVRHEFWPVSDPRVIESIQKALSDDRVLIADGHHRYESSLAYRNEQRKLNGSTDPEAPYEYVMMHFVSAKDEGMTIWPIHRVVKSQPSISAEKLLKQLPDYFEVSPRGEDHSGIGLALKGGKQYQLRLLENEAVAKITEELIPEMRSMDVTALHTIILSHLLQIPIDHEHIFFTRSESLAIERVEQDGYEMAFLLNPTPIEQVYQVAATGTRLPQKTTYFYPKLLSGLVINKL